jgi:hypothetical protein
VRMWLPSQAGVLPSQAGVLPSQAGVLPSQAGVLPSQAEIGRLAVLEEPQEIESMSCTHWSMWWVTSNSGSATASALSCSVYTAVAALGASRGCLLSCPEAKAAMSACSGNGAHQWQ